LNGNSRFEIVSNSRSRPITRSGTARAVTITIIDATPRVWHWCGNDPVKAHYQQANLNELVILFGYATFNPDASGLTEVERRRFEAAEVLARELNRGMWTSEPRYKDRSFDTGGGLNISGSYILTFPLVDPEHFAQQH
jgi:hypothetical protein